MYPLDFVGRYDHAVEDAGLIDAALFGQCSSRRPQDEGALADLGGTPLPSSPADFGKLIAEETEKWAKVIKFAGIKPE